VLPSRPGEFHPEPLTDPDLNLSIHPARVTARRLPPSAEPSGSSRYDPVGPSSTAMTCPLGSTGITPLHRYYEAVRPSPAHRYFRPPGCSRLRLFPWHRRPGSRVPSKSPVELRPPTCRMPLGPSRASPKPIPEAGSAPGFDIAQSAFDTSAAVRLRSPLQPCLTGSRPDFSATFTTVAFDDSSLRWLEINT
jgi:hypothetical protein